MPNNDINNFLTAFAINRRNSAIKLACYALNGLDDGCCSDKLIKAKTNLSFDTIHKGFKDLEAQRKFIPSNNIYSPRYGRIIPSTTFYSRCIKPFLTSSNNHFFSVTGTIKEIDKNRGVVLLQGENAVKYRVLCHNEKSAIFFLPIDLNITFQGSLLFQDNNETCIWINETSLECNLITKE